MANRTPIAAIACIATEHDRVELDPLPFGDLQHQLGAVHGGHRSRDGVHEAGLAQLPRRDVDGHDERPVHVSAEYGGVGRDRREHRLAQVDDQAALLGDADEQLGRDGDAVAAATEPAPRRRRSVPVSAATIGW